MSEMDDQSESIEAVTNRFYHDGKTDGLPVVPPTQDRIERMLMGTDESPEMELGTLGTRKGILTVETVAVNGVMAGCLPIHMPVLLAGAEALVDPQSNAIQASVSTGSWAYLWLVNGPIRETLDINSSTGAFGPGFRSNATIARALGLIYKNCARIHPGEKEMSTIGNPFKCSLLAGENETESPWHPYHVEHGFEPDESTITFAAPNCFIQPGRKYENTTGVVRNLIDNTPPTMIGVSSETANERYEGNHTEVFYALCPYNVQELADYSKAEIKSYIHENAVVSAEKNDPRRVPSSIDELVPVTLRQFEDPEHINLIVVGGSGRRNVIMGPTLGGPTTKRISLPDNWDDLVATYGDRLDRNWGLAESV